MNASPEPQTPRTWRTRALVALSIAVAAIAAASVWLSTSSANNNPNTNVAHQPATSQAQKSPVPHTPAPSVSPLPPETPGKAEGPGLLDEKAATNLINVVVAVPLEQSETEADLATLLSNVTEGDYLAELTAQWQELVANGWSVSGAPTVVSTEVTDLDVQQGTATVLSCLDSSGVELRDDAGDPIGAAGPNAARALHLFTFTLDKDDGVWRASGHTFPHDPSC